jgi:hypothetical protein
MTDRLGRTPTTILHAHAPRSFSGRLVTDVRSTEGI